MTILGISAYHGDCSAAILRDGRLVAAVEEERFTRVKHWAGFPEKSIRFCLKAAGCGFDDIDWIAVAKNPKANLFHKFTYVLRRPGSWALVGNRLRNKQLFESMDVKIQLAFGEDRKSIRGKIFYVEHHLAHLASAFFVSPMGKAALVSVDGLGDFVSAMYGIGEANKMKIFKRVYYPHSIGLFYTMLTQFLGFKKFGDEYKVMGLASYGKPTRIDELEEVIHYRGNGDYRLNMKYFTHSKKEISYCWESGEPRIFNLFSSDFIDRFGNPRDPQEPLTQVHKDLAASMQKHTENILFGIMKDIHHRVNLDKLALAGGVAMNSVANGKIIKETPFKEVYIPPAAGDAGTSMGAAFYLWNQILEGQRDFNLDSGYWGPQFSKEDISAALDKNKDKLDPDKFFIKEFEDSEELIEHTVDKIVAGKVVGWFQGKMEFGARALGNRSIVVDPRRHDMKDILNARIKKREGFRPFAPSILIEKTNQWFDESQPVPFMERVYRIRPTQRDKIPAVTHVDGSGRLQTVSDRQNSLYYGLIKRFGEKTGVPILLNTSFNENEPIVCTPDEALAAFVRTKMDVVVLGKTMISRVLNK